MWDDTHLAEPDPHACRRCGEHLGEHCDECSACPGQHAGWCSQDPDNRRGGW